MSKSRKQVQKEIALLAQRLHSQKERSLRTKRESPAATHNYAGIFALVGFTCLLFWGLRKGSTGKISIFIEQVAAITTAAFVTYFRSQVSFYIGQVLARKN